MRAFALANRVRLCRAVFAPIMLAMLLSSHAASAQTKVINKWGDWLLAHTDTVCSLAKRQGDAMLSLQTHRALDYDWIGLIDPVFDPYMPDGNGSKDREYSVTLNGAPVSAVKSYFTNRNNHIPSNIVILTPPLSEDRLVQQEPVLVQFWIDGKPVAENSFDFPAEALTALRVCQKQIREGK